MTSSSATAEGNHSHLQPKPIKPWDNMNSGPLTGGCATEKTAKTALSSSECVFDFAINRGDAFRSPQSALYYSIYCDMWDASLLGCWRGIFKWCPRVLFSKLESQWHRARVLAQDWKTKLSTTECGHKMDGWLLCARCPEISLSQSLCRLFQKSFRWDCKPSFPMCLHIYYAKRSHTHVKDPAVHVRVQWLWKHQNNPACTKSVSLHLVEVGRYWL